MTFSLAAAADWTNDRAIAAICSNTVNAAIPATTVMHAGTSVSGAKCTEAFEWTVYLDDYLVTTGYNTKTKRQCRFCSSTFADSKASFFLKDYAPPTTGDRKITRLSVWAQATTGAGKLSTDTMKTHTPQNPVEIASNGCGKTGQETKKETKGQSVEFSIKSPVPLAKGQMVIW